MATPNLSITLPTVGGSTDTWGTELNTGITVIDTIFSLTGTDVNMSDITFATVTSNGLATLASLTLATGATVTGIDNGDVATGSATLLATQGAVKTYVDAQIIRYDTLTEILANGNTTGAYDIVVTAGQKVTTDTIAETTAAAGVTIDSVLLKDNAVTATTFTGALTGNASTATALETARTIGGTSFDGTASIVPATITVADTTDTTSYVALFESATGDLAPKTDAGVTYNAGTGMLTATGFTGPLTGNVTGNVTGDVTGDLTGDVTGNVSGTAATVTGATQAAITTAANLVTVGALDSGSITSGFGTINTGSSAITGGAGSFTTISGSTSLALATGATVTGIDNGSLGSSATLLATQGAIKTYVDAQVGTVDTLAEVLANGNTTGSTNIIVSASQKITTDTIDETTAAAGVTIDSVLLKDNAVTATTFTGALTGNASTATALETARTINGTSFDGTANITVTAAAGTLTGATLASGVTASSLTSVGTLTSLGVGAITSTGAFVTSSVGPHAIGGSADSNVALAITGSFGPVAGDANMGIYANQSITGTPNEDIVGFRFSPQITEAASGTHSNIFGLQVGPSLTGAGAAVGNTASLYVAGAMSGATNNYALWVDGGASRFDGNVALQSDASVLSFGADSEITLTHSHNDGLILNTDKKLYFYDATQYIYSSAANDLSLYGNGTTMTIKSEGVGIGTTAPSTDLDISGTSGINITNTASGWLTGLKSVNTNANSSPSMITLEKISTSPEDSDYIGGVIFKGRNDADEAHNYVEQYAMALDVSNGSETSKWWIGTWGSGTEYTSTLVANAGRVFVNSSGITPPGAQKFIVSANSVTSTTNWQMAVEGDNDSGILFIEDGTKRGLVGYDAGNSQVMLGDNDGDNSWRVATGSDTIYGYTGGSAALTIDSSQNVGIGGVTAPTGILSIPAADTTTKPQVRFLCGDATDIADAALSTTDDSGGAELLIASNLYYSGGSRTRFDTGRAGSGVECSYVGRLKFFVGSGSAQATQQMTLDTNGYLGIGDTSPGAHIDIQDQHAGDTGLIIDNQYADTAANAYLTLATEGGGGDPKIKFVLGGGGADWAMGVDNSDSDKFKISGGTDTGPALETNPRLTIDGSGNVGIGTTSPTNNLDIYNASGWGGLDLDGTSGGELRLLDENVHYGSLYASSAHGVVLQSVAGGHDAVYLHTAGSAAVSIDSSQDVTFAGSLFIGGTGSANELDDYEEGTWTPAIRDLAGNLATLSTASGSYTKIGRQVICNYVVTLSSKGSMTGSYIQMQGMPFNHADNNFNGTGTVDYYSNTDENMSSLAWDTTSTVTVVWLTGFTAGGGSSVYVPPSYLGDDSTIKGSLIYHV